MKNIFLAVIRQGGYDLNTLLAKIDRYHVEGKLTNEERDELMDQARGDATMMVDPSAEIQHLWAAIRELRAAVAELAGEAEDGTVEDEGDTPEYIQPTGGHDAYYKDDVVTYKGKEYVCVAPDNVACVWSPDAMPSYWREL